MLRDAGYDRGPLTDAEKRELFEKNPKFKEMNEDPPASVVRVREEMQDKTAASNKPLRFPEGVMTERDWVKNYSDRLEEKKVGWESLIDRKKYHRMDGDEQKEYEAQLKKKAEKPQYRAWKGDIFHVISKDTYDWANREGIGKTAAVTAGGKWGFTKGTETACTAGVSKLQKAAKRIANALYAKDEGSVAFLQKHAARAGSKTASMLLKAMEDIGPAAMLRAGKTAGKSGNGLYGFSEKTAKLGLDACSALHHEAGVIAADLFARKGADPVKVAGYLTANAKKGKCAFSAMLAEVAPDVAVEVTGTVKKKATDFLASDESADDEVADIISKC